MQLPLSGEPWPSLILACQIAELARESGLDSFQIGAAIDLARGLLDFMPGVPVITCEETPADA